MSSQPSAHNYVLIMAGGAGTRLWPISRQQRPKQFQSFVGEETLLQHIVGIASTVVPTDHLYFMATPEFAAVIKEQIPGIAPENLLFEPARRDNGPAIVLGMLQIQQRDPEACVAILWSDHLIQKPEALTVTLQGAFEAAKHHADHMIVIGAHPTRPDTGLGWIQMGKEVGIYQDTPLFRVKRFVEKPDLAQATQFLNRWEYLWNVGYKIVTVRTFFERLASVQPDLVKPLQELRKLTAADQAEKIATPYEKLPKLSIEYLLTQYMDDLLVVPADLGWSDIGNWETLHDVLKEQKQDHLITQGNVLTIDTENSLILGRDRLVAAVGLKDVVIVDDGDAVLVMHRSAAQHIKKVIQALEDSHKHLL
jgi:mannose-1-phosphate guanylyltransferase